jgi:hypothetical protein
MSGQDRTDRILTLLGQRGAYKVFFAMGARGGTATFVEIATSAGPDAAAVLRSMAVEGLVLSRCCGSLDLEPPAGARFCMTAKGEAVFGHLVRLQEWIAARGALPADERPVT